MKWLVICVALHIPLLVTLADPLAPNVTLVYFNGRGRAEQIRWILAQTGVQYEDRRIEQSDWPALKSKTPLGSLPYLIVDDKEVATSGAVAMFVAKQNGLAGTNNLETAQCQMMWEVVQDAFNAGAAFLFEADATKKAAMQKEYNEVTLPKLMRFLGLRLKDGKKWLVGDKLTMADLIVGSLFEFNMDVAKTDSVISDLVTRVMALPAIKAWIAKRASTPF